MLKKKLMAVGIATVFTLSSLTTTVFAANLSESFTGTTVKFTNPGKGNGNVQSKDLKDIKKLNKFIDSKDVTWALNAIEKLAGKGIITGIGYGKFAPNNKVTHLEALAMVFRLTGDDTIAESLNNQVHALYRGKKTIWGQGYINLAIEKEILLEDELEDFNPNTPAKRHDIAKYIIRALGETKEALKHMDEDLDFKDSKDIPEDSVGYVYMVNELSIMMGDKNNKFNPTTPVTRAEMAVLLDRAEGKFDLPDTDKRKSGTVFVSADEDDNEINVKIKGTSYTYEYLDDVNVYKDGDFADIDDLVAGDVLQLTFNSSKKIIFIEVIKNVAAEESNISFTTVSYSSLPKVLKDEVDDLKSKENYKAYEYNNYIYLLAAMGKKNTGGYDIDIEKINKVEDDDKYTIEALVDTDEPSSGSIVTQSITYPYSIVKFKSFDDIQNVVFIDSDDDELEDVDIEDVDEVSSVEGEIYDLISSSRTIKIEKSNGSKVSYTIPSNAEIEVNGDDDAKFSDLEEGMRIELELDDNKVTKVEAEDAEEVTEVKGIITAISTTKETISVKKTNNAVVTLTIPDDAEIEVDGDDDADFSDLKVGMAVELELVDNEVTEVYAEEKIVEVEGTITAINTTKNTIDVKKSNGTVVTLTIPDDAEITVNDDEDENFSDLEKGMSVEIEIINNVVTEVIAEDKTSKVTGEIVGISSIGGNKITLLVDGKNKVYSVGSGVEIVSDGDDKDFEDLKVHDDLILTFDNGTLVKIEIE